jgi:hypothetical protein
MAVVAAAEYVHHADPVSHCAAAPQSLWPAAGALAISNLSSIYLEFHLPINLSNESRTSNRATVPAMRVWRGVPWNEKK